MIKYRPGFLEEGYPVTHVRDCSFTNNSAHANGGAMYQQYAIKKILLFFYIYEDTLVNLPVSTLLTPLYCRTRLASMVGPYTPLTLVSYFYKI